MWYVLIILGSVLAYLLVGALLAGLALRLGLFGGWTQGEKLCSALLWPLCLATLALLLAIATIGASMEHVMNWVAGEEAGNE